MPLYAHVSGERQHADPDTPTHTHLAAAVAEPGSGWRLVDEPTDPPAAAAPTRLVKHRPAPSGPTAEET